MVKTPHVSCAYLKANLPALNKTDAYVIYAGLSKWIMPHILANISHLLKWRNWTFPHLNSQQWCAKRDGMGLDWTTKFCWVSLHFGGGYISTCVSSLKAKVLVDILWLLAKDWKEEKNQVLEGPFNYTHKKLSISLTNWKFS